MTATQPTSAQQGSFSSSSSSSSSSWMPPIPRPLQRIFDSVPLLTYPANELPSYHQQHQQSPTIANDNNNNNNPSSSSLPTLHVFTTYQDAAQGRPSFNPSCLKWQTYLRFKGVPHSLAPSTNHASPTGSLPFLLPALPTSPDQRLDTRPLLPIPSSRLEAYAERHSSRQQEQTTSEREDDAENNLHHTTRKQQAYHSLLDTPIRNAWLYTLYLSPANEPLLRSLYLAPASRSTLVQRTILSQLRRAARSEIAKTTQTPTPVPKTPRWSIQVFGDSEEDEEGGGGGGGGLLHDILTFVAIGGSPTISPELVYAEAKLALEALEASLSLLPPSSGGTSWFFNASQPTLFDAAVFSYTYLLLAPPITALPSSKNDKKDGSSWGDDILRRILLEHCPKIVAHAQRIVREFWGDVDGLRVPESQRR